MLDENFWKKYFKVYDILNLSIPYQELLEKIVDESNIKKGDLVLEAGVGTGNLALLLKKQGARVIGLDFSQEALEIYRNKDPQAEIVLSNLIYKLPFKNNFFDKIVSNNVLYNIPREKRVDVLRELKRVLKPGGKIVISNIHKRYKPMIIYLSTIVKSIKKFGFLKTLKLLIKIFIPTIKIFYYNFQIQKVHKLNKDNLFAYDEQKKLLEEVGFCKISETKKVFANQGILNSAYKL